MGALTSFGDIKDLKEALTGGDPLLSAIAFAFLAFVVIRFAFKHIRVHWYKLGAGFAIGLLFLGFYGTAVGLIQLTAVAAVFLVVVVVVWLLCWRDCGKKLGRIVELADPMLPSFDDVESFIEMQGVNSSRLTARQLDKFNRFRVSCHIALGDCNVARTLLSEGSFEPAFKHFSLGVIADGAGDHELFRAELDRAFASVTDATDAFVALQLEHNRAIAHVNEGQFRVADGDLEKVRAKVKARGFCNKAFLNLLYENLVLNKTRLDLPDGGASEGWALIDECAESLDSANGADRGAVFNLKLLFLRQLGAGSDEKAGIFDAEVSDTLNDDSLSENQRAVAMASLGRIAWADGLDPTRVLDYFGKCDLGLEGLRPADRVFVFKNLFIMLGALRTSHPGLMRLAETVAAYYENGMSHDLDAWERTLPSEALRLRAQILRERAALCQVKGGNGSQVASYLDEAVRLLEQPPIHS